MPVTAWLLDQVTKRVYAIADGRDERPGPIEGDENHLPPLSGPTPLPTGGNPTPQETP